MTSTQSLHNNEIVISFFAILQIMVKHPNSQRIIGWHLRIFDNDVARIKPGDKAFDVAHRMSEELALCMRRKRSRRSMYSISLIDEVYNHYWVHKSPKTLGDAWRLFETGRYKTEVMR